MSASSPEVATETKTQKRLLRESLWVIGGRVFGIATAIGTNVVLARVVSPADFGLYFVLASILTFATLVAMFGLNTGLVRFVSESIALRNLHRTGQALRKGSLLAGLSLSITALLCFAFVVLWGKRLFGLPDVTTIGALLALSVVAWGVIQLCASLLRSFHDSRWSILLTGQFGGPLCNTIFMMLIIALFLIRPPVSLEQVVLCSALSLLAIVPLALRTIHTIGASCLTGLATTSNASPVESPASDLATGNQDVKVDLNWMTFLTVCWPLMLTQCLSYVTGQADIWIGGASVSPEDMALYGAARRLMLLIGIPMQLVNLTVIASIAELRAHNKLVELQRILRSAATLAAIPALLISIPILAFPAEILALLFGDFYSNGAHVLRILCVGQIVFVCVGAAELTLMMAGQQMKALWVNICTSLALFGLAVLLTRSNGISGLAIAWSLMVSLQCIGFCFSARLWVGVWTIMDPTLFMQKRYSTTFLLEKILKKGR